VENVVLVLPVAAGAGSRGDSVKAPDHNDAMAGFIPAVLADVSGALKVTVRASNKGGGIRLLLMPRPRQDASWWVGSTGDGGKGADIRKTLPTAGGDTFTSLMAWLP